MKILVHQDDVCILKILAFVIVGGGGMVSLFSSQKMLHFLPKGIFQRKCFNPVREKL